MIFWINSLNKTLLLPLMLLAVLLAGCIKGEPGPPPLRIDAVNIIADGAVAKRHALQLRTATSGGQGGVVYDVRVLKEAVESSIYRGPSPTWRWSPKEPGVYRLRVIATDAAGTVAGSDWSTAYHFRAPVDKGSRYAVLPIENLSDRKAPLQEIHARLVARLTAAGLQILDNAALDGFLHRHRIRHVGGIDRQRSLRLQEELGVDGVVITALETWYDTVPPRVALIARVVATGDEPELVWIDSVGLAGDEAPGLLGLGRVDKVEGLLEKALAKLADSFGAYLAGKAPSYRHATEPPGVRLINGGTDTADSLLAPGEDRHQPQFTFRAATFDPAREYRVALVPLLNVNARKHAGSIVTLHLAKQLHRYENVRVIEPGLVREILLRYRMVMQTGPSLAAADVLAAEKTLDADLIVSGKVFDYQDLIGECKVDFSMQAFDGALREIVWTSRSHARGNDGVYFFNQGRIPTAHGLTSLMTRAAIQLLEE